MAERGCFCRKMVLLQKQLLSVVSVFLQKEIYLRSPLSAFGRMTKIVFRSTTKLEPSSNYINNLIKSAAPRPNLALHRRGSINNGQKQLRHLQRRRRQREERADLLAAEGQGGRWAVSLWVEHERRAQKRGRGRKIDLFMVGDCHDVVEWQSVAVRSGNSGGIIAVRGPSELPQLPDRDRRPIVVMAAVA